MEDWRIMGVVNVTPDSFSDGGRFVDPSAAAAHGFQLALEGAHILDVGGESTRPGAEPVLVEDELARTLPVLEEMKGRTPGVELSIDTCKPRVAMAAVKAGAAIWNDVSALTYDDESLNVAADLSCKVVLMHAQGDPKTMQDNPCYDDVVEDVYRFLATRIEACVKAGVEETRLIVDPGIGFGKTLAHNLSLIANLDRFDGLGRPVLLGASRKRFIAALDREGPPDSRLGGSLAAVLAGWRRGGSIFRVHDVAATRQALTVAKAIESPQFPR